MPTTRKRRNRVGDAFTLIKTCPLCGCARMVGSFPRLPGESRRHEHCSVCLRFPSAVAVAATA